MAGRLASGMTTYGVEPARSVSVSTASVALPIVTSTTGSPTIDTSSRPGKTIYKFTGSGSITLSSGGYVEALACGGGSGGQSGSFPSSGGGGDVRPGADGWLVFLPAGTHTITVGAAGAAATDGGRSSIGSFVSAGGGIANSGNYVKKRAGGGMQSDGNTTNTGGGGAGGDGGAGSAGAGVTSTITGSSVEYGRGGLKAVTPTLIGQGGQEGANPGTAGIVIIVVG